MAPTSSTRTRDLDADGRCSGPKWPMVVLLLLVLFVVVSLAAGWVDIDVRGGDLDVPNADVEVDSPDVDVDSGNLPDVDVQGGDLPDVDVDPAE